MKGELVGLRPITPDDYRLVYDTWHHIDVQRNLNFVDDDSFEVWLDKERAADHRCWLDCAVISLADGKPAGIVQLGSIKAGPELVMLLLPGYRGRGLGTEAARLIIDYGFAVLGISRVGGGAHESNHASQHMLDKLGFVRDPDEDEPSNNTWGEGKVTELCYHLDRDTWLRTRRWTGKARPAVFDARPALETIKRLDFVRECGSEGEARAMDIIAQQLTDLGVAWRYHTFEDSPIGSVSEFRNLIAEIPGAKPDEIVVMGAHIDSYPGTVGASDDAAGCAILLEAAKWFVAHRPARTARLAWFTGEEIDRRGSRAYVRDCVADPGSVRLVVNVDSSCEICPGGFMIYASDESVVAWACEHVHLGGLEHFITNGGGTDARSFIERGMRALMLEAPSKQSEHLPDDRPETIDPHKLQFLGAASIDLAAQAANEVST